MNTPLKTIIVHVANSKGGIGKTTLMSLLSQYIDSLALTQILVDADPETSTLSRLHPTARFVAIRDSLQIDSIIQIALEERPAVVVVDLPARANDEFTSWFNLVPFEELSQERVEFASIGLVAGNKDSIESMLRWHEVIGNRSRFFIAINRRDDVSLYLGSNARKKFQASGVAEFDVPKLDERLATELDRKNWTIAHAVTSEEPHFLTQMMTRARLRRYRDSAFGEFAKVKGGLLP